MEIPTKTKYKYQVELYSQESMIDKYMILKISYLLVCLIMNKYTPELI